jgi:3-hydroxyisobutyrate dehydrogenase
MKTIGIVGLGIMGKGMALNFIKHGYTVNVWNRTRSVAESIESSNICDSPKQVAELSDIIFEVTADDKSSEEVWTGEHGILAGAKEDKVLILSATTSVEWADKLAEINTKQNFKFLDIPLTGGRIGAETGQLTLLCGGNEDLINELKPTFKAIAANIFHFGPVGHGMRYKLILNYIQGAHLVAFGQAMNIAKKAEMDLNKVAEGLAFRPGGVITGIAKDAYFKDPIPLTFSIEWITKDLKYVKKLSDSLGLDLTILNSTLDQYSAVVDEHKDEDWAAINKLTEKI